MATSAYLIGAVLLAILCWFAFAVRRSHQRLAQLFDDLDLGGVQSYLEALIESREPGAYLIFEEMGGKRFVQFRRDVGTGGATLTCHFPRAPWSHDYIGPLRAMLDKRNITMSEVEGRVGEAVSGFIVVEDLHSGDAAHLTDTIFRRIFRQESLRVRVWGHGVKGIKHVPEPNS